MPIRFFCEEIEFKLAHPTKTKQWITKSVNREGKSISEINYVFCSDEYLLKLNHDYLNHQTFTDIITFDNSEGDVLTGEIYISVERVMENALKYKIDFWDELHRVMIHGVLHLCGYKDKKYDQKASMRKKEDAYLSLRKKLFHVKRSA